MEMLAITASLAVSSAVLYMEHYNITLPWLAPGDVHLRDIL